MTELTKVLSHPSSMMAPRLLGCELVREVDGQVLRGRIVEVEAYDQTDAASHSYRGPTKRNATMFGPAGHLYVYFTYGMHYCCNVVTGQAGEGSGVLIRALEPLEGEATMSRNRAGLSGPTITNGPGKLCQALGINRQFNGHDLTLPPIRLVLHDPLQTEQIIQTTRIGIREAQHVAWRWYVKDNPYVSRMVG